MLPSRWSDKAIHSPSLRRACLATLRGIRTAKLFPHFDTIVSFAICIYFKYTPAGHSGSRETVSRIFFAMLRACHGYFRSC